MLLLSFSSVLLRERRRFLSLQFSPSRQRPVLSDVESDDYSESARSYELGKASDFACARPRPDFSAFLCLWRKVTIGWEMRPVRLVLQNIRNFFSQNGWCLPSTKNSRSCKGSNKAESAGAKGQRKAWWAAFHDFYGCPSTFNIIALCHSQPLSVTLVS